MKETELLTNNLLLISDINRCVSTVCFGLYFRVGAQNEEERNCGISHLTEHMFFRRLNTVKNKELYFLSESLGGAIRGCTTRSYVFFELTVLSEFAGAAFDLMNRFLCDFSWTEEEVEREKEIILDEMALVGNSTDELLAAQTGVQTFLLSVKGTPESLRGITAAAVNEWKREYFHCGNACFVVTGNFGETALCELKAALAAHKKREIPPRLELMPASAFARSAEEYLYCDGDENFADVFIYFDLDLQALDLTEVQIVFDAFCNGDGSKLSFNMKDLRRLVYEIDSALNVYGKYGSVMISWSLRDDKLMESLNLFFALLNEFTSKTDTDAFESSVVFSTLNMKKYRDDPKELNAMYGFYDYIAGIPFSVEACVLKRETLSAERIRATAEKVFSQRNMFVEVDFNKAHLKEKNIKKLFSHAFTG